VNPKDPSRSQPFPSPPRTPSTISYVELAVVSGDRPDETRVRTKVRPAKSKRPQNSSLSLHFYAARAARKPVTIKKNTAII